MDTAAPGVFSRGVVLRAYGTTDRGRVRPTNEDCFAVAEDLQLLVVADGLGGHNAGEVAARLAVDAVVAFIRERQPDRSSGSSTWRTDGPGRWTSGYDASLSPAGNLLRTAILDANVRVLTAASAASAFSGMGTTIVAALIDQGRLSVAHVGDSRLYLLRRGRLRQLTRDDAWEAAGAARGRRVGASPWPDRNGDVLTSAVGTRPVADVHVSEETLTGGDLLLLTTDGVHDALEPRHLHHLLAGSERRDDLQALATSLVRAAHARGSRDDCTAVIGRWSPRRAPRQPTNL